MSIQWFCKIHFQLQLILQSYPLIAVGIPPSKVFCCTESIFTSLFLTWLLIWHCQWSRLDSFLRVNYSRSLLSRLIEAGVLRCMFRLDDPYKAKRLSHQILRSLSLEWAEQWNWADTFSSRGKFPYPDEALAAVAGDKPLSHCQNFTPILKIYCLWIGGTHPSLDNVKWTGLGYEFLCPLIPKCTNTLPSSCFAK